VNHDFLATLDDSKGEKKGSLNRGKGHISLPAAKGSSGASDSLDDTSGARRGRNYHQGEKKAPFPRGHHIKGSAQKRKCSPDQHRT